MRLSDTAAAAGAAAAMLREGRRETNRCGLLLMHKRGRVTMRLSFRTLRPPSCPCVAVPSRPALRSRCGEAQSREDSCAVRYGQRALRREFHRSRDASCKSRLSECPLLWPLRAAEESCPGGAIGIDLASAEASAERKEGQPSGVGLHVCSLALLFMLSALVRSQRPPSPFFSCAAVCVPSAFLSAAIERSSEPANSTRHVVLLE
jgi:hypothetical protein